MDFSIRRAAKRWLPSEAWHDLKHIRYHRKYREMRRSLRDFASLRAIFVHIPKTAGCSVGSALFPRGWGGHTPIEGFRHIFGRDFWSFFKFTFVRNPFTRLVSAYDYLQKGGHPRFPRDARFGREVIGAHRDFSDFVLRWLSRERTSWEMPHFAPQVSFLRLDGEVTMDLIGRVESIDVDFRSVADRLGVSASLGTRNRTVGRRRPLGWYYQRDDVIRTVQRVFAEDFEELRYSIDPPI